MWATGARLRGSIYINAVHYITHDFGNERYIYRKNDTRERAYGLIPGNDLKLSKYVDRMVRKASMILGILIHLNVRIERLRARTPRKRIKNKALKILFK